jgi:hypothetical protein
MEYLQEALDVLVGDRDHHVVSANDSNQQDHGGDNDFVSILLLPSLE